ncbi:SWIM zinc finger family protein [Actinopolymorpha alba]|uniref:SWIM zinc finger family protein n=1 Tax=Actinopolymorpha alba TaxID=533267 RepID=UPI000365D860|nr:SWIM zinc finger family protein [Actinopolymorpha alba]
MAAVEHVYAYQRASSCDADGLVLATSGGVTERGLEAHPHFFAGDLDHPQQNAAALLTVARVARTRFYTPPGMVAAAVRAADPVVTSNVDRLRFESFSADCGVYSRLDLLPGSLARAMKASGTTNVDFNPPTRAALAGIGDRGPLHLAVGLDEVAVSTLAGTAVERRVKLPHRWLKGFAEVQVATANLAPRVELSAVEARRFLRSLPRSTGRGQTWAVAAGRGLRLTTRPHSGAVCVSGPERLHFLNVMSRYCRGLTAYGPPVSDGSPPTASAWQLQLDDAALVVVLSPEVRRGFSGEGGVLTDLADDQALRDADLLAIHLGWEPDLDPAVLSASSGLGLDRVLRALACLGGAGRVGFDLAASSYFHRELPYDSDAIRGMHPRLRDAHALVDAGAVRRVPGRFEVTTEVTHRVRLDRTPPTCTCQWWGKHQGQRGPCKHVLAAGLIEGS